MSRTMGIKVIEIDCKSALSSSNLPDFDYSLNPYLGCAHGCKYCYAPSIVRIPREEWGKSVKVKRNIPKILANELKKKERGVVGISTTTDPYQPVEDNFKLTRLCLAQLLRYDFPVSIITKSPLVTRDLDILSQFTEAEVGMTITTCNDEERKLLEPAAPSIESRISALQELGEAGITTYAFLGPLYPTITQSELEDLIVTLRDAEVSKIIVDRFNLRPGILESVLGCISCDTTLASIWRESLRGENKIYDVLFSNITKLSKENEILFEIQEY